MTRHGRLPILLALPQEMHRSPFSRVIRGTYTLVSVTWLCGRKAMTTTVSADVLAAQLELAEELRTGREHMLNPQDLPGATAE